MITYEELYSLWIRKGRSLYDARRGEFFLSCYPWQGARCYILATEGWARYNIISDGGRVVFRCRKSKEITILRGSTTDLVEARLRGLL